MNAASEARLVADHTKWVYKLANEYAATWRNVDVEDLVQEGLLGLLLAIRSWRSDAGASLATYAIYKIRLRMRQLIGDSDRKGEDGTRVHTLVGAVPCLSLDAATSDEGDMSLHDVIPSPTKNPEEEYAEAEMADVVRKAVHKLSPREQRIIRMRFVEERSLRDVEESEELRRTRLSEIEREAVSTLKLALCVGH